MPSRQQLESALINADAAGDIQAATALANALKRGQYDNVPRETIADPFGYAGREVSAAPDIPALPGGVVMSEDDPRAPEELYPGAIVQDPATMVQPEQLERQWPGQSVIEPALTVATGAIAEPIAGAVGLTNLPFGADRAADLVNSLREAMTYVPSGSKSMENLQSIAEMIEPIAEPIQAAEQAVGEAGFQAAGPLGGALGQASVTGALEALGLGGIRRATRTGKRAERITEAAKREPLVRPDGQPTDKMAAALDDAGIEWDDLKADTQGFIARQEVGSSPEETARLARFEEIEAPALKGQISKDLEQRKMEQGLMESTSESAAEPIRQTMLRQSEAIKGELEGIVNGATGQPGEFVKSALTERKKALKATRKKNYDILAENARNYEGFELSPDAIIDVLPDRRSLKSLNILHKDKINALENALNEFGIIDPSDIEGFLKSGGDIEPLNLGNFEDFRKILVDIEKADQSGTMSRIIIPIKKALDEEIDIASKSLEGVGGEIAEAAKEARRSHIALRTEFDQAKMTSKLIDSVKRGSSKAKIEGSQVMDKLMAKATPIEEVDRVLESLRKAGPDGHRAIREMQGRAVLDLLDSAFTAQSRQVAGTRVFGATPYSKQFEKLRPKLESLFKGDKAGFKRLENVYKIAQDIIPPNAAIPKGSAGFLIDALSKMGVYGLASKFPGAGAALEVLKKAGESRIARKRVDKALDANPKRKKKIYETMSLIKRDYPQLAFVLGVNAFISDED